MTDQTFSENFVMPKRTVDRVLRTAIAKSIAYFDGSGGHGVNEIKANNVLFFDLKNVPLGPQRAPTAIAPATQLEAVT